MARTVADRADAILALADTFRTHGYQNASLATIAAETGLGKGSLYHFFPGGKEEMATAVLDEVKGWFQREVYQPLTGSGEPSEQLIAMFAATIEYFESRNLVCLFGSFALGEEGERFAAPIRQYFEDWITALQNNLERLGLPTERARPLSVDVVSGIQGALVVGRALRDPALFHDALARLERLALSPDRNGKTAASNPV
jgi:TetR/AcrR family transcriptional repressor of lmrAB and yxaGH operons